MTAAMGVAAAPSAGPALLQLGPGKNAWTIGVQYPTTDARLGDTLVRQPHCASPRYQSCPAAYHKLTSADGVKEMQQ